MLSTRVCTHAPKACSDFFFFPHPCAMYSLELALWCRSTAVLTPFLSRGARARECFFHFRDCFALSWKSFRADKALIGCVYIYVEYVWCIEDDRAEAQKFIACNRKPDFILTLFTCFGGPFWISNLRRPRERKSERVRQKFYATAPYIDGRKCALLDVRKSFWAK